MKHLLTTTDVARLLGVHEATVADWCRKGRLPGALQPNGYAGTWSIPYKAIVEWVGPEALETLETLEAEAEGQNAGSV